MRPGADVPLNAAPRSIPEGGASAPDVHALFEGHSEYVRTLLSRLLGPGVDPDDLTQEVLIRAWRKPGQFDGAQPRPWLRQIAIHAADSFLRKSRVRRFFCLEAAGEMVDARTPERAAEVNEELRLAYAVLDQMTPKRRTVLVLFEIQGLTGEEIAESLKCPLSTVHTRLFHARRDFHARIEASEAGRQYDAGRNRS
jgi:RNA polymerase sigma-70 factor (ECF subfamily)